MSSSVSQRFDSIDGLQDGAAGAPGAEGPPGLEVGVWGLGFSVLVSRAQRLLFHSSPLKLSTHS